MFCKKRKKATPSVGIFKGYELTEKGKINAKIETAGEIKKVPISHVFKRKN